MKKGNASGETSVFPILLVTFISTLGFSIILPFLVFLVKRYGGNDIIYGFLGAVYPAFQLIGAPLLGRLSDKYGRKKILLLSQIGTVAGWILFYISFRLELSPVLAFAGIALTSPLIILFLARAVDGLTGGNISVANAYLADISDEKNRKVNFGKISVASNLGFIVGPALAGLLGATALREELPVIVTTVISAVAVAVIFFMLPDSERRDSSEASESRSMRKLLGQEQKDCIEQGNEKKGGFKEALGIKGIPFLYALYFFIFLGFSIFYTAFPVHALEQLKWSITEMGIFFAVLSLIMVIVQGPVLKYLSGIYSDETLVIWGNLILAANFVLLLFPDTVLVYSAAVFFAAGNGLMWPSFLSVLAKTGGKVYQGTVQGIAGSIGSLASIIGLIFGGVLYSTIGTYSFLLSAVIIFIVFTLSFRLRR